MRVLQRWFKKLLYHLRLEEYNVVHSKDRKDHSPFTFELMSSDGSIYMQ